MRVLVLSKDPTLFEMGSTPFGDARERHCRYAAALQQRFGTTSGIRVIAYTPRGAQYRREVVSGGLELFPTRSLHRASFLLDVLRLLPTVLRDWRPHVITAQTPWEEGTLGWLVSRVTRAAFLPQVHVDLFSEYWQAEHPLNKWRRFVALFLMRRAAGVRVVSEALRRRVAEQAGLPIDRVFTVPIGAGFSSHAPLVSKQRAKARLFPDLVGHPVVLFVGRFYAPKNLALWVDVAHQVLAWRPDARFVMAGDGVQFREIRNLVGARGLTSVIRLLGAVAYEHLPEIYAAADVFLITSHYEGFGRVVVEALLSGVPVVATASASTGDILADGVSGFIVGSGDPAELAQRVVELLDAPERSVAMGAAGRVAMEKRFSTDALVQALVDCWGTVAEKHTGVTAVTPQASNG